MPGEDHPQSSWLRYWSASLLAPTAVGAGLALYDLTGRSIWLDEGSTFAVANQHGTTLWHLLVSAGGNFFLYYPFMHVLVSLFGSGLLVLRLPSAIAAVATIPVAAVLLTRLFDRRAATCGSWLLAFSGPLVFWAQQARGYSFAVFFVTAAALGLVTAMKGQRRGWWFFAGCSVLAIYCVLLSALAVAALAASVGLIDRRSVAWRSWAVSLVAIGVAGVPLYVLAIHRGIAGLDWLGRPGTRYGPSNSYLVRFLLSAKTSGMPVTFAASVILVLMAVTVILGIGQLGRGLPRHGRSEAAWSYGLLVLWLALPPVIAYVVSFAAHPVLVDRYILTSVPAASMLAGVVLSRLRPRLLSTALAVLLTVALGYQLRPSYGVALENWKDAAAFISGHAQPHDCAAYFASDGYDAVDFYVETGPTRAYPSAVLPAQPYRSRTSYALDPAVFTPSQLAHAAATCSRIWLVRSHAATGAPSRSAPAYQQLTYTRYRTLVSQLSRFYGPVSTTDFRAVSLTLYGRKTGTTRSGT